jgi:hypothetical protein
MYNNIKMENKYICVRCNYTTDRFMDLKRHITKKTLCIKCTKSMSLSDDQLLVFSLIPFLDINDIIINNKAIHLQNSNVISKNKKDLFNILNIIDKNKIKICNYCNIEFGKVTELKKHVILNCFYNKCCNTLNTNQNTNNNIEKSVDKNIILNNLINSNNNSNNNNSNNTINIYFDIKPPIPFDDNWDISKINENFISGILNSKYMYTKLLQEILENEINLNVIIDTESKSGLVYKNDIDKYIRMKSTEIVYNTMEKLKNHLLEINKNDTTQFEEVIDFSKKMINKKYIDFNKDPVLNKNVNDIVNSVFDEKKTKATQIFNNIIKNTILEINEKDNNKNNIKGF